MARLWLGQTLQRSLGLSEPDASRTGGNCSLSWLLIRCPLFPTGASEGRVSARREERQLCSGEHGYRRSAAVLTDVSSHVTLPLSIATESLEERRVEK